MSRPSCIVCGANEAACSCQHQLHGSADHGNRSFSIFPILDDQLVAQPPGDLQEFQFFSQISDHESVNCLFDDDPPHTVADDDSRSRLAVENNHQQKPSTFVPFGPQYHPGNGLTFEVSLDVQAGEVDAGLGLAPGGSQLMEPAASATIVNSGPKESQILNFV